MNVNLFFNWLWIGELLTFKTGPPCIIGLTIWELILDVFRGTFRMEREDGYTFDCRIPPFSLESKPEGGSATPPETV